MQSSTSRSTHVLRNTRMAIATASLGRGQANACTAILHNGRGVDRWLAKAPEAEVAVYLLPSRTDTAWWHEHAMRADEIRFLRGRVHFIPPKQVTTRGGAGAPFASVLLIYGTVSKRSGHPHDSAALPHGHPTND